MQIVNVNGFDKILCDHDDALTAKTILYTPDTPISGGILYIDRHCQTAVTTEQLTDAFIKGCVISVVSDNDTIFVAPIMCISSGAVLISTLSGTASMYIAGDAILD